MTRTLMVVLMFSGCAQVEPRSDCVPNSAAVETLDACVRGSENALDTDSDGIRDLCDRCPEAWDAPLGSNTQQFDHDNDLEGDACDADCPDAAECQEALPPLCEAEQWHVYGGGTGCQQATNDSPATFIAVCMLLLVLWRILRIHRLRGQRIALRRRAHTQERRR